MRKFLTSLVLLVFMSPCFLRADETKVLSSSNAASRFNDDYQPVYDVDAKVTDDNNVKVRWSWDEIVPNKTLIDFESGDLSKYDFDNTVSNFPWVITENAYEGSYAIKSTNEGMSNSTSAIEITVDVLYDGLMGFNYRISSEKDYDLARFYIDGVMMMEASGDHAWSYREFEISEGTHTYRWEYAKDVSYEDGDDALYLDNVMLFGEVEPFAGGWIYYDDGECLGSTGAWGAPVYWAITFPNTEAYAGLTLSKVAIYDHSSNNAGTHTVNIYIGGTDAPGTLVSTTSAQLTGIGDMVEIELETPVELDGKEPLWISFYATGIHAPATVCAYADDPNSDWYSSDGVTWTHLDDILPDMYSWMIRGYLETPEGKTITLENEKSEPREIQFNSYKVYRYDYFGGEISDQTVDVVATGLTDTLCFDNSWTSLDDGVYQWGVSVVYDDNKKGAKNYSFQDDNESVIVWSNTLDNNMLANVSVEVTTNNNASPAGTLVKFVNKSEPEMGYDFEIVLDETGTYSWNKFRKGTYELTISKAGFESDAENKVMQIWADATVECELEEVVSEVDLYVSPTGWAMWTTEGDNALSYEVYLNDVLEKEVTKPYYQHENIVEGQTYTTKVIANYYTGSSNPTSYTWTYKDCDNYEGTTMFTAKYANGKAVLNWLTPGMDELLPQTLSYGFETNLDGWTTIDANLDDHVWYHSSECESGHAVEAVASHTGVGHICSESYCNANSSLFPDDYVVAPEKVVATATSKLTFWAAAQDEGYAAEHFGVAVSTEGNTSASDFTTIVEWTMVAKGEAKTERGTKAGNWYQYEADLSSYEGQEIWVAIRHFNTTDMFMLLVDDAELIDVIPMFGKSETSVIGAMVYRDGELVTPEPVVTGRFSEPMEILTEREYCVRVVYGGEMNDTYYAMSCPECITVSAQVTCYDPEDLYGIQSLNDYNQLGVRLVWPYSEPTSNWLYYDDGNKLDAIGGPEAFSWGIMFPAASLIGYQGTSLIKVALFDVAYSSGYIKIYQGGYNAPSTLVHTQPYSVPGTVNNFVELELTTPLTIDITKNLWITFSTLQGATFPAAVSANCGDPNSRWISLEESLWEDMSEYGLNYSWMIRAYVDDINNRGSKLSTLSHYNVYRGESADSFEFIGETLEETYFDKVNEGTYYYQVTAVYTEEGEECESNPANAYGYEDQDYIVVEVKVESVNENAIEDLSIYPNPTKDVLNIAAESMTRLTITNTLGQVVYDKAANSDKEILDMSQYESGIYMIRVTTENGVATKRITIVR